MPEIRQIATNGLLTQRLAQFRSLLGFVQPVPESFVSGAPVAANGKPEGKVVACSSYDTLMGAWSRALSWTPGLDRALSCMLSSVLTTNLVGEQLWFQIIGPPSSGKTTLLEGISTNRRYIVSKDTIRGFYSGWKGADGEDSSLLSECLGMTLAMKEGDAFVKAPNVQQILSEGRGIYDRVGRIHYRNQVINEYEGARMTWIICGTSAIREEIDCSELGARFLTSIVMDGIDEEFEDEVLWQAVNQERRSMSVESNGDASTHHPRELLNAMRLTGGYVTYLRENALSLIEEVFVDQETLRWCSRLGKFIAYMRARPSKKDEHQEREFAARLAKQMVRLVTAMSAVRGQSVDLIRPQVLHVALDTARGLTLQIVEALVQSPEGMENASLCVKVNRPADQIGKTMRFLTQIGVVEFAMVQTDGRRHPRKRYVLSKGIQRMFAELFPVS